MISRASFTCLREIEAICLLSWCDRPSLVIRGCEKPRNGQKPIAGNPYSTTVPEMPSGLDLRVVPNARLPKLQSLSSAGRNSRGEMSDPHLSFLAAVLVVPKIRAVMILPNSPVS